MNTQTYIRDIKPFLKWAGGKKQLLPVIRQNLPTKKIKTFIEPFIGGGAVFFEMVNTNFADFYIINDYNEELINAYTMLKTKPIEVLEEIDNISEKYLVADNEERKKIFYKTRECYNLKADNAIQRAAYLIFLNKTCFNGLYRVNSKGEFNVPMGRYKNPQIYDKKNIIDVANTLKDVKIISGDFTEVREYVNPDTFVYFDPPYRPLNATSNFTSYSRELFNDEEQIRLAEFFRELDRTGAALMLSNSDPRNIDKNDDFFDKLYSGFNIRRIFANRFINSKSSGRGQIMELLITNY